MKRKGIPGDLWMKQSSDKQIKRLKAEIVKLKLQNKDLWNQLSLVKVELAKCRGF